MKYAGTKTELNLREAFAGESQACNQYTYFASVAKKQLLSKHRVDAGLQFGHNSFYSLLFSLFLKVEILRRSYGGENAEEHQNHDDFNESKTRVLLIHGNILSGGKNVIL